MTANEFCKEGCDDRMDALQRYLEVQIEAQRRVFEERFTAHKTAVDLQAREVQFRFEAQQEALRLQAGEYARRLEALNQAHERADKLSEKIIGRDTYEQDRTRNTKDHEEFKHDLTVIQTRSLTMMTVWGSALAILSIALGIIMHFL